MNKRLLLSCALLVALGLVILWRRNQPAPATPDVATQSVSPTSPPTKATPAAAAEQATARPASAERTPVSALRAPAAVPAVAAQATSNTGASPGPAAGGSAVRAAVRVGDRTQELVANEVGDFQRINVRPNEVVAVRLVYPQAQPGTAVAVQVMDGGRMQAPERPAGINHDLVRLLRLDQQRAAELAFQVTDNGGMHRLLLTQGADKQVLDFWVDGAAR